MIYKEYDIKEVDAIINILPVLNKQFSDKSYESLLRCKECGIKHDFYDLTRVSTGIFLCKFCLKRGA